MHEIIAQGYSSVLRQRLGSFLFIFDGEGNVDITYLGRVCSLKNVGINAVLFAARYPEIIRAAVANTAQSNAVALARIEELVFLQKSYRSED